MVVTATEFKSNPEHYLEAAQNGDITITKNGKLYARLTGKKQSKVEAFSALCGIIPADPSLEEIKESRMRAHESHL